jgi:hypothetical protein
VASLTLNGAPVAVKDDGTWSAEVALHEGDNPLTAVVTDHDGGTATATGTVKYTKPVVSPVILPAFTLGKVTFVKNAFKVPVSCTAAAGASCKGTVKALARVRVKVKSRKRGSKARTRLKTITLASATVTVPAGQKKVVTLKLTRAARGQLQRSKRLRATIVVTQTVAGKLTTRSAHLTITAPKAKKARHH